MERRTAQVMRHIAFEDLGSFAETLREAGYDVDYVDAATADIASLDPLDADLLVILGGPVGVYDQEAYPTLAHQMDLLRVRLVADRPTLGICLGAQLIAAALDAKVYPGPVKEIGWSMLDLTAAGDSSALKALEGIAVLHWHGDTFDLPAGCQLLASTDLCRHQAISRGSNLLALQFHAELSASNFEHWLIGHAFELGASGIDPAALRAATAEHGEGLELAARSLLKSWLAGLR